MSFQAVPPLSVRKADRLILMNNLKHLCHTTAAPEQQVLKDAAVRTQCPWCDIKQKVLPLVIKIINIQAFFPHM